MNKILFLIITFFVVSGCTVSIPSNQDDICKILDENPRWENMLYKSSQKWGSEPSTLMAIIRQESSFDPNAAPDREKILGFIPWKRPSSAKGYSQAVDATWDQYKRETGNYRASRSSFESSIDFVGWYLSKAPRSGINLNEVDKLYVAYHEGYGGFQRGTYREKEWLLEVAKKVKFDSIRYKRQLNNCPIEKPKRWWNIFG